MNTPPLIDSRSPRLVRRAAWLLAFAVSFAAPLITSCRNDGVSAKPANVDYYTCTMHPSVKKQSPTDKCPICSMDLTPVEKRGVGGHVHGDPRAGTNAPASAGAKPDTESGEDQPTEFTVAVERQQQIGVTYGTIEKRPWTQVVRAVGIVAPDKRRQWAYVTRGEGYVKQLFVFSRGERVEKNAPVLTLSSPDLLTAQTEFVDALRTRDEASTPNNEAVLQRAEKLVVSVRQRLTRWNLSNDQIGDLEKSRQPQETMTITSPFQGVVQDIGVDPGHKVMNGDPLVDLVDLSGVWVWAQFYQDELPMLKPGQAVSIFTSAYPGATWNGKISVIDPFINDALRTGRVRIEVENADLKLRPGMYVDVELTVDMGEGVAVPVPAVLPTGQHNIIFVDKGGGKLEPRFIELGRKFGDYYEVKSGLRETERVVTSANFLIDAEAKVQGALKSF